MVFGAPSSAARCDLQTGFFLGVVRWPAVDVPTNRITEIINGERAITGDSALRLWHFFGNTAQFWLNLQMLYELRLAEERARESVRLLPTLAKYAKKRSGRVQERLL